MQIQQIIIHKAVNESGNLHCMKTNKRKNNIKNKKRLKYNRHGHVREEREQEQVKILENKADGTVPNDGQIQVRINCRVDLMEDDYEIQN